MQHDQMNGVGVSGADQRLRARHPDLVVEDGYQSVRQMSHCLFRDGGHRLGVNDAVDDDLVVHVGMGKGVVVYGKPAGEFDDTRGLASGEGRQEGVDPLQF
ncbi:hypothetical protein ACIA6C_14960 [Streptomyces sp. NPDC051578]|uniref:hypothetical protein n=1 Tax=Streptomyces sp. NPDC051578 TaxID=3365662 RepID=UPI0037917E0F